MEDGCTAQRFSAGSSAQLLISHYPPVLFIQAVSQSHLSLTLCQHCLHIMGKHFCYLSLKGIFVKHVKKICISYNLLLSVSLLRPHPHPTHTHTVTQLCIQIHAENWESQIRLALFPTGILANTWLAGSKAALNCYTKVFSWLMLADFYILNWIPWQHFGTKWTQTVSLNRKPLPLILPQAKAHHKWQKGDCRATEKQEATSTSERMSRLNNSKNIS